ncbi:uncharacterized protein LOC121768090 isoform X2 [Salvia splendens]|uniref:uncharacterized protein LOC121768090 isoform X2 n=1 Tax=Salvia splendens TaxID=180675 RepID=UPI001C255D65|nr:uncharacterized protein LOC121768090 isoform X2 [Salvia splendens]
MSNSLLQPIFHGKLACLYHSIFRLFELSRSSCWINVSSVSQRGLWHYRQLCTMSTKGGLYSAFVDSPGGRDIGCFFDGIDCTRMEISDNGFRTGYLQRIKDDP